VVTDDDTNIYSRMRVSNRLKSVYAIGRATVGSYTRIILIPFLDLSS
jgi:hypothetical protein